MVHETLGKEFSSGAPGQSLASTVASSPSKASMFSVGWVLISQGPVGTPRAFSSGSKFLRAGSSSGSLLLLLFPSPLALSPELFPADKKGLL